MSKEVSVIILVWCTCCYVTAWCSC